MKERHWVPDPENRALLFQSVENGAVLRELFPDLPNLRCDNLFGENLVVSGVLRALLRHCIERRWRRRRNGRRVVRWRRSGSRSFGWRHRAWRRTFAGVVASVAVLQARQESLWRRRL